MAYEGGFQSCVLPKALALCMQRIDKNQRWRKLEFWWPLQTLELLADVRKCLNFRTYFSSLDQSGRETKIAISNTTANWQVGFIAFGSAFRSAS